MENVLEVQQTEETKQSRRSALLMGGAALAGLALTRNAAAQTTAPSDSDILNFALNLEYLEAQFYSLAVNGTTIDASNTTDGSGKASGTVTYKTTGSTKVNFVTPQLAAYAAETANDELNHVKFLRSALTTSAVGMPNINLVDSFNALAAAAGITGGFDPFANETNFLVGAFIFEDVGVTAYLGAAPLISSKTYLTAALDIHAVEAYHAGRPPGAAAAPRSPAPARRPRLSPRPLPRRAPSWTAAIRRTIPAWAPPRPRSAPRRRSSM